MAKADEGGAAPGAVDAGPGVHEGPPPPRRSRLATARRFALEIAVVVGVYLALSAFQERHLLGLHARAPSFELNGLDGERVSLDSLHGKRVVLVFWATWCGVCRHDEGALNAVAKGLSSDEALYAIVADSDDEDRVRAFVRSEHIKYPVLLGTSDVLAAYHVNAFPTTYYLDSQGRVGSRTVGMSTRFSIRARLGLLD